MTFELRALQSPGITAHHCGIAMLPPECESVTNIRKSAAVVRCPVTLQTDGKLDKQNVGE